MIWLILALVIIGLAAVVTWFYRHAQSVDSDLRGSGIDIPPLFSATTKRVRRGGN